MTNSKLRQGSKQRIHPFQYIDRIIKQRRALRIDKEIRRAADLTPVTEFAAEDIFIVGYPKSGNTWFRYLVTGVFYGVDPEYAPHTLVNSLIPNMHVKQYYQRFQTPMFFKSHFLPRPDFRRVVYLLRDGRDAMVSYYHHQAKLNRMDIDFLSMVRNGEGLFPCKWHEHVESWLSNPFEAEMIVITYEDLKKDTVHELRRFCEFAGIERDDLLLNSAADKTALEKMRRKEEKEVWNPQWSRNQHFVRRGQVGSYKDEMPADVLDAFLDEAGDTLQKHGYLTEIEADVAANEVEGT